MEALLSLQVCLVAPSVTWLMASRRSHHWLQSPGRGCWTSLPLLEHDVNGRETRHNGRAIVILFLFIYFYFTCTNLAIVILTRMTTTPSKIFAYVLAIGLILICCREWRSCVATCLVWKETQGPAAAVKSLFALLLFFSAVPSCMCLPYSRHCFMVSYCLCFLISLLVIHTICFCHWCVSLRWCVLYLAGVSAMNSGPWILVEDLSSVYNDIEVERGVKHAHKKRKLTDGREKTMVHFSSFLSLFFVFFVICAWLFLMPVGKPGGPFDVHCFISMY